MLFNYGQPKKTRSKQIYTESEKTDGTWLTCVLCAKFTSHHSGSGHHHHHHLLGSTGRPDVPRRNCLNVARRERVDARVVPPNVQEGHPFARFCGGGGGVLLATWFIQGILNSGFPWEGLIKPLFLGGFRWPAMTDRYYMKLPSFTSIFPLDPASKTQLVGR